MSMNLQHLLQTINSSSVIRYSVKLAPTSGDGLVCPPTYKAEKDGGPPYIAFRRAFVDGELREIVVLDSPQSQSNRIEHALLKAHRDRRIYYPDIVINFPPEMGEPGVSVLELSHRIYDAFLYTSEYGSENFFSSDIGVAIKNARPGNATALFKHAPITLVLGGWDSQSGTGPRTAKIQRLLTSEIIGLDAQRASLSATKFDVMDIRSNVKLIESDNSTRGFEIMTDENKPSEKKSKKIKRPSELGFGSIPGINVPGAVISGAIQTSVLSCSGLRSLAFPKDNGEIDSERNQAGRAVLAALVLYGFFAQMEAGYLLRSRCELVPKDDGQLELIGRTLKDVTKLHLSAGSTLTLLNQAIKHAAQFDLSFRPEVLHLNADDRLVEMVKCSRETVLAEGR